MSNEQSTVTKIVSGGQTGVDRAALDVALYREIPHGGWCPAGRRSEAGPIPEIYELIETDSRDYALRTEKNVVDSDGTLILHAAELSAGTALTLKLCRRHRRVHHLVDLEKFDQMDEDEQLELAARVQAWLFEENVKVLNVAGPRESTRPGIGNSATAFLLQVFRTA